MTMCIQRSTTWVGWVSLANPSCFPWAEQVGSYLGVKLLAQQPCSVGRGAAGQAEQR